MTYVNPHPNTVTLAGAQRDKKKIKKYCIQTSNMLASRKKNTRVSLYLILICISILKSVTVGNARKNTLKGFKNPAGPVRLRLLCAEIP